MDAIAQLERRRYEIDARRTDLFALMKPIEDELTSLYKERDKIQDDISRLKLDAMEGVDWSLMLKSNGLGGGMTLYKRAQREFDGIGFYMSGYWPDTEDAALQIMFRKDDAAQYDKIKAGVETIAPFMTPQKDGALYFSIVDRTLSRDGVYRLQVTTDLSTAAIYVTRYGNSRLITSGPFEAVLRFVQSELWCHGPDEDLDD